MLRLTLQALPTPVSDGAPCVNLMFIGGDSTWFDQSLTLNAMFGYCLYEERAEFTQMTLAGVKMSDVEFTGGLKMERCERARDGECTAANSSYGMRICLKMLLNMYISTWTAMRLTRRICVPTCYGPSGAVSPLECPIGRYCARNPILPPYVEKRHVKNCILCVGHSVDFTNDRRSAGGCWIYIYISALGPRSD
jgi:hypothetical protein